MSDRDQMERVEIARQRRGLTQKQLAAKVGVSVFALDAWSDNKIPKEQVEPLAEALGVDKDWISSGAKWPYWYIADALASPLVKFDWSLVKSPQSKRELYSAWLDRVHGAVIDWLRKRPPRHPERLPIPKSIRVRRWQFMQDLNGSCFCQFQPKEMMRLAQVFGCWPGASRSDPDIQQNPQQHRDKVGQRSLRDKQLHDLLYECLNADPMYCTVYPIGLVSENTKPWNGFLCELSKAVDVYRKASLDLVRRAKARETIRLLLHSQQPKEPLLTGGAIEVVLQACVRAAWIAEILGPMHYQLRAAIEMALITEFRKREFTISDLGQYLLENRGLRLPVRPKRGDKGKKASSNQKASSQKDTVSESTLRRTLNEILKEANNEGDKKEKIPLKKRGRKWYVDYP